MLAWWAVHESGIHATIAGVALGLLTRVRRDDGEEDSPAEHYEHVWSPISSSLAVPFFALMSAGVVFAGGGELVGDPVVIGVVAGLVVGKPIGVLLGGWLVARFTQAELDPSIGWRDVVGVALLAGIGFTVSLLVSDLSSRARSATRPRPPSSPGRWARHCSAWWHWVIGTGSTATP